MPIWPEHPIIFGGESIRAIFADRKSQTRRVIKPQPPKRTTRVFESGMYPGEWVATNRNDEALAAAISCPYGRKNHVLWVRETFRLGDGMNRESDPTKPTYAADWQDDLDSIPVKWKSPLYLKRAHCRLLLEVKSVRAERLQDLTMEDAIAEGVEIPITTRDCPPGKCRILTQLTGPGPHGKYAPCEYLPKDPSEGDFYRAHYASVWDSLNAKRGFPWSANPWIWRVEFSKYDAL